MPGYIRIPVHVSPKDQRAIGRSSNSLNEFCSQIMALAQNGLTVHAQELLTYAMFKEQCSTSPGFQTYIELQGRLPSRWTLFTDYVDWSGGNIVFTRTPIQHITESMGVAAALSTAQTVFPVTDADFQRIAETSRIKTFDYTNTLVGSTGARFLQIEAKGTHDNKSTRSQARDIRLKKARQAKAMRADGRKDMAFAATVLDVQHQSKNETRITFCDPPADTIESDPFVYRLLARLTYYWQQIRYIVPTGRITVALANRLRALEAAPDQWQSLREVPLVAGNGEPLEIPERMGWTLTTEDDRFRPTRVFGTIIDLRLSPDGISRWSSASELPAIDPPLLFIGLDEQVLVSIVTQDYHAMSELLFLPSELRVAMPRVSGSLYRVRSGLVSGRIDHRDWRKEDIEKQISRLRRRRRR